MSSSGKESTRVSYRDAGVDIDEGKNAVDRLRQWAARTHTPRVQGGVGGFGGFFAYPNPDSDRLLISSMDGVGTKLKIAAYLEQWKGVGYDIVSHCVSDILVHGARPMFFLDYIASGRLSAQVVEELVEGMSEACVEAGCALIGGETAEMPGIYAPGECDVVGTIVGEVARNELIDGSAIRPGDRLLGLPSAGLHTNGFSLARRILGMDDDPKVMRRTAEGLDRTWGDLLLERHRMYFPRIQALLSPVRVHGLCHITGGGLIENLPRILPSGCRAVVRRGTWEVPELFQSLVRMGNVVDDEAYRVFNMGIGFVLVVDPEKVDSVVRTLTETGPPPAEIGWIEQGKPLVRWEDV